MSVRRALLFTSADRYLNLFVNFALMAIVAHLLPAEQYGHQVLGAAIYGTVLAVRDFASPTFLIQKKEMSREDVQAQFTLLLSLTLVLSAGLSLLAPFFAHLYGAPALANYVYLIAISILLELVWLMLTTLMRRDMQFGRVAVVNITNTIFNAGAVIFLVLKGQSFLAFAYAAVIAGVAANIAAIAMRADLWAFKPRFERWSEMVKFGAYNGFNAVMFKVYDSLPYLVLARMLPLAAVSFYNRALVVCQTPDKIILGGVVSVILPAFSQRVRTGGDLKGPYLRGMNLITALQWPALVLMAILAHPVVSLVLGEQWLGAVPLVQIIALAWMAAFCAEFNFPMLVAVGAMRENFLRGLIVWPVSGAILITASFFGIYAVALSSFIIIPFQSFISLLMVRRHVPFAWRELWESLRGSAMVTAISAIGPLAFIAYNHFSFVMSFPTAIFVGMLSGIGWLIGLWACKHPLAEEIEMIARHARRRVATLGQS